MTVLVTSLRTKLVNRLITQPAADPSHRHLAYMLESRLAKPEKTYFNALSSSVQCVEYLQSRGLDFGARRKMPMWDARRGYSLL